MPAGVRAKHAFTLIEFLIALVIIGFIVAILVGVFSNPLRQAKLDSSISQIRDGLRQIAEAAELAKARGLCGGGAAPSCTRSQLVTDHHILTAMPPLPSGILADHAGVPDWSSTHRRLGGCDGGPAPRTNYVALRGVSDEICRAYNAASGLDAVIVPNCTSGADCSISGSMSNLDFGLVGSPTFCYYNGQLMVNVVVYHTSIAAYDCDWNAIN